MGATGFEPVTSSVSANSREPLCGRPFSQVAPDRKGRSYRDSPIPVTCTDGARQLIELHGLDTVARKREPL